MIGVTLQGGGQCLHFSVGQYVEGIGYRDDCKPAFKKLCVLTFSCIYIYRNPAIAKFMECCRGEIQTSRYHNVDCKDAKMSLKFFNKTSGPTRSLIYRELKSKVPTFLTKKVYYEYHDFLEDSQTF